MEAGGKDIENKIEGFKGHGETAGRNSRTQIFATTLRTVINANEHKWGAILEADGQYYVENQRDIPVPYRRRRRFYRRPLIRRPERLGAGKMHAVQLLGLRALFLPALNDYGSSPEDQVWNIYAGNARVKTVKL